MYDNCESFFYKLYTHLTYSFSNNDKLIISLKNTTIQWFFFFFFFDSENLVNTM